MRAQSAVKPSGKSQRSLFIRGHTRERSPISVQNVGKLLPKSPTLSYIREPIQEKRPKGEARPGNQSSQHTRELSECLVGTLKERCINLTF